MGWVSTVWQASTVDIRPEAPQLWNSMAIDWCPLPAIDRMAEQQAILANLQP